MGSRGLLPLATFELYRTFPPIVKGDQALPGVGVGLEAQFPCQNHPLCHETPPENVAILPP